MKLSVWLTVSDVVSVRQTLYEHGVSYFDKKHRMFKKYPPADVFKSLNQAGVEGVELLINKYTDDHHIIEVKGILDRNHMPVVSIHQSLSHRLSISLGEVTRLCRIAQTFSASVIVLHLRALGQIISDREQIFQLKKLQKKYSVLFGIENGAYMRGRDFAACVNRAGFFMTFDMTHLAHKGGDIMNFYRSNKNAIINIHVSDHRKSWCTPLIHQVGAHQSLGQGSLLIKNFLMMLKKEKYQGLITMEINAGLPQLCQSAQMIRQYT